MFTKELGRLKLANWKITDIKENRDIKLPDALSISEEVRINLRLDSFRKCYTDYKTAKCSEKGDQKLNLKTSQTRGFISLRKRIKKGELLILKTDKSGKMCVASREMYLEMGKPHTKDDDLIYEDEAKLIQSRLNAHCTMLSKMFKIGCNWDMNGRIIDTVTSESIEIPPMYLLVKDHKLVGIGELTKSRAVVSGCQSMGIHMANILSDILEPIANILGLDFKFISTEDMLAKLDRHNSRVGELLKH